MADSPEAIRKSIRTYLFVGGILFIGTVLTVLVATVPWLDVGGHGFDMYDAVLGLAIATTKATLVAMIFMHLNHEKKAIYWIFGSGFVFVFWLFVLTALAKYDPIKDPHFKEGAAELTPPAIESPKSGGSFDSAESNHMSLRGLHIVFVTVSLLLFVFLMLWGFLLSPEKTSLATWIGFTGLAGFILMPFYGVYFLRKARRINL